MSSHYLINARVVDETEREPVCSRLGVKHIAGLLGLLGEAYSVRFFWTQTRSTAKPVRNAARLRLATESQGSSCSIRCKHASIEWQSHCCQSVCFDSLWIVRRNICKHFVIRRGRQTRSTISAMPWPTPIHMVHRA